MNESIRRILEWLSYALIVMGIAFTLLSFWMTIFKVGRSPPTALAIGLGFFAAAYLVQKLVYKTCPRCGSTLIKDGRCQVCDYDLTSHHPCQQFYGAQKRAIFEQWHILNLATS